MPELRRMRPLLGTFVEAGARGAQAGAAVDAALARIAEAQAWWSFHDADSELSRLNRNPGRRLPLRRETLRLLRLARALMQASGGSFDCTLGGLLVERGVLPDHGGPAPLPRGRADDILVGDGWAALRRPLRLTLDGIAKGFAVDLGLAAMRRQAADAGWINAGGDLRVFGEASLPVQRREMDGRLTPLGRLRDAALASSRVAPPGDEDGDAFPSCIVAPDTLRPGVGVWTVLARSAWRADGLTKVAANTPGPQRAARIRQLGGQLVEPASSALRQVA